MDVKLNSGAGKGRIRIRSSLGANGGKKNGHKASFVDQINKSFNPRKSSADYYHENAMRNNLKNRNDSSDGSDSSDDDGNFHKGGNNGNTAEQRILRSKLPRKSATRASDAIANEMDKANFLTNPMPVADNEANGNMQRPKRNNRHHRNRRQKLFPKAEVTIGPWIDNGFYYDFDSPDAFTDRDLKRIKKQMDKIIRQKLPLILEEVSRDEAHRRIEDLGEPYKVKSLSGLQKTITLYHIGDKWWDLCAGLHVEHTGELDPKAISLESVAGAYWRCDGKNAMLQRIYETAWENQAQLDEYVHRQEEAKRRDHRTLGAKLSLFTIQESAGGGLVFWHPKGAVVRRVMEDFWKEAHLAAGYQILYTPHVANVELWKQSGHFDFYHESMFNQMDVEGDPFQLRPTNYPFHCLVFKDGLGSYRDLPMRWAAATTVEMAVVTTMTVTADATAAVTVTTRATASTAAVTPTTPTATVTSAPIFAASSGMSRSTARCPSSRKISTRNIPTCHRAVSKLSKTSVASTISVCLAVTPAPSLSPRSTKPPSRTMSSIKSRTVVSISLPPFNRSLGL